MTNEARCVIWCRTDRSEADTAKHPAVTQYGAYASGLNIYTSVLGDKIRG